MTGPLTGTADRLDVAVPFGFDDSGRTSAPADVAEHVEDLIEMLLFTSPGERLNRPDFGTGLLNMVHENAAPEVAATIEYLTQGALQRWLSDVLEVRELRVSVDDNILNVELAYSVRGQQRAEPEVFRRSVVVR